MEVIGLFFTELFNDIFGQITIPFVLSISPAIAAFVLFVIKKRWSWAFIALVICGIIGRQGTSGLIVSVLLGGAFLAFSIWTMNNRSGTNGKKFKLSEIFKKKSRKKAEG